MCEWGGDRYTGASRYEERQAVCDGGIVTANGSADLEFTRLCLLALGADTPERIGGVLCVQQAGDSTGV